MPFCVSESEYISNSNLYDVVSGPHADCSACPDLGGITLSGLNVEVGLVSQAGSDLGISVTFQNVYRAGVTTIRQIPCEDPGVYAFIIDTTAGDSGWVTVTFAVPPEMSEEEFMSLTIVDNSDEVPSEIVLERDYATRRLTGHLRTGDVFMEEDVPMNPMMASQGMGALVECPPAVFNGITVYGDFDPEFGECYYPVTCFNCETCKQPYDESQGFTWHLKRYRIDGKDCSNFSPRVGDFPYVNSCTECPSSSSSVVVAKWPRLVRMGNENKLRCPEGTEICYGATVGPWTEDYANRFGNLLFGNKLVKWFMDDAGEDAKIWRAVDCLPKCSGHANGRVTNTQKVENGVPQCSCTCPDGYDKCLVESNYHPEGVGTVCRPPCPSDAISRVSPKHPGEENMAYKDDLKIIPLRDRIAMCDSCECLDPAKKYNEDWNVCVPDTTDQCEYCEIGVTWDYDHRAECASGMFFGGVSGQVLAAKFSGCPLDEGLSPVDQQWPKCPDGSNRGDASGCTFLVPWYEGCMGTKITISCLHASSSSSLN